MLEKLFGNKKPEKLNPREEYIKDFMGHNANPNLNESGEIIMTEEQKEILKEKGPEVYSDEEMVQKLIEEVSELEEVQEKGGIVNVEELEEIAKHDFEEGSPVRDPKKVKARVYTQGVKRYDDPKKTARIEIDNKE